jgi:ATP-binding cassette subfamily B protein
MIVVMSKGEILEVGRHDELLKIENGHYRQLYFTQFAKVA